MSDLAVEKHLKDYWDILSRRRWVAIAFMLICAVTVTLGTLLMTPVYRASTTIMVEGESPNILNAEESSSAGAPYDIFENYLETQMSLIKSDSVAGRIYEDFKLEETKRYRKRAGIFKIFRHKFGKDIELKRLTGTRMIEVSVYNPDPKMAADLANGLAEDYAKDNLKRRSLTFIRNQRMASLNSEFLRLQSKLDSLSNTYGPKHPEMIALREEIRAMAARMNDVKLERADGRSAKASEEQGLLEDSLLKIQESSVLSSSRMNNIVIVDRAYPPNEIAKPKIPFNIALGLLAGFFGGLCLAFLVEYMDDTIKSESDLKRHLGLNTTTSMGTIPLEPPGGGPSGAQRSSRIDHLVALHEESPSAEAYRHVRTAVLWYAKKENGLKDFAVVSAGPGEGKTTVASNIAIALAQVKDKVLLVDTDMRRGRLHQSYGMTNDKGLGQYLTEEYTLGDVVKQTEIPHLSIVTCGESVINSSQLLSSPKMEEFIHETRKRFDIIVYDTPPVNLISDTALVIAQLNGVLLAVRSGVTGSRMLPRALATIRATNVKLIGAVLNGASEVDKSYYKYYHKKR